MPIRKSKIKNLNKKRLKSRVNLGNNRRTMTSVIPKLPINAAGVRANIKPVEEPHPIEMDNVDFYKKSDCLYYGTCLEHAAKSGWDQFHCRACKIYEHDPSIDMEIVKVLERMHREQPV